MFVFLTWKSVRRMDNLSVIKLIRFFTKVKHNRAELLVT